jgi:hypothetical protein
MKGPIFQQSEVEMLPPPRHHVAPPVPADIPATSQPEPTVRPPEGEPEEKRPDFADCWAPIFAPEFEN